MRFFRKLRYKVRNFVYGMTVAEIVDIVRRKKFSSDVALMIVVIGDLLGIPVFAPLYKLNLLKFWTPRIRGWKEHISREKDFLEKAT